MVAPGSIAHLLPPGSSTGMCLSNTVSLKQMFEGRSSNTCLRPGLGSLFTTCDFCCTALWVLDFGGMVLSPWPPRMAAGVKAISSCLLYPGPGLAHSLSSCGWEATPLTPVDLGVRSPGSRFLLYINQSPDSSGSQFTHRCEGVRYLCAEGLRVG